MNFNDFIKEENAPAARNVSACAHYLREEVLTEAAKTVCTDRNAQYGEPEDNFAVIAELWDQYLRRAKGTAANLNAFDVGMMMLLFKVGRIETGTQKRDSFIDAAGYIACAAEIALRTEAGHAV